MAESKLYDQSMSFAVSIVNLVKDRRSKHETIFPNQIGRSGTSIGANIREAQYAHSKLVFFLETSDRAKGSERNRLLCIFQNGKNCFLKAKVQ